MDVLILTFPHGLVPVVGLSLDLLPYGSKIPVSYGLVCLVEYDFDNIGVCYPFNRIGDYILDLISFSLGKLGRACIFRF